MIHFEAVKNDLGKLSPDMVPETKSVVSRLYYLVPIAVLILLLGMGRSVVFCANIATLSIVLLAMLKAETRFTFKSFIEALVASSRGALMVSACCACSGLIVGVLSLTGIGYKFINPDHHPRRRQPVPAHGLPHADQLRARHGHPDHPRLHRGRHPRRAALIKAGAPQLVAHMFVFYYAILSFITPPVCVAAFAGAAIAESKAMETGFIALKLGIVAFIVPYMFVYQPALLGIGETPEIIWAAITAIIGVIGIAGGMQGWLLCSTSAWERVFLLIGGLTLIYPGLSTDIIGFGLLFSVGIVQMLRPQESTRRRITPLRQEPFLRAVHPASRRREGCFGPTIISHKQLQGVLR